MHSHNNVLTTTRVSPGITSKLEAEIVLYLVLLGFLFILLAKMLDYLCPRDTVQAVRLIPNSDDPNSSMIDRAPCYDVAVPKPPDYAPPESINK